MKQQWFFIFPVSEHCLDGSAGFGVPTYIFGDPSRFQLGDHVGWNVQDSCTHVSGWYWLLAAWSGLDLFLIFFVLQAGEPDMVVVEHVFKEEGRS